MFSTLQTGFRAAIFAGVLGAFAQTGLQAQELKMLSSWSPANKGTYMTEVAFMKMVEEDSKGRIKIRRSGPEAVPPFEQVQPVAAGVFDILITHGAYHSGTTTMGMALDAIAADPGKRRSTGVWDIFDAHYQKHGLKTLAFVPQGESGYHLILRQPVGADGGLQGRKIRGTVTYHPLIRGLGGAPVVLPGGEVFSALEKGVVDGAAWPTIGVFDLKWHEVAKHFVRPSFGVSTLQIFINANRWKRLSEEDRKLLLEAGRKIELSIYRDFDGLAREEEENLKKAGMTETRFSPENQARVRSLWEEGIWQLALKKHGQEAKAAFDAVKKAGMGM